MATSHYHALDAQLAKAGAAVDPMSLDVTGEFEPVECPCCQGARRVLYVEGDYFPAPWVSAGGGDMVRDGERCPTCLGAGLVEVCS